MKKLLLGLVLVFGLTSVVNAQEVGAKWIGGSVGFNSGKVGDGDRVTTFRILPEVGYVMSENLAIGVRLGYAQDNVELRGADGAVITGVGAGTEKSNGFGINPFVRYTFLKGDLGSLFAEGGIGYLNQKGKDSKIKTNTFEVGITPGVSVSLSEKIALIGNYGFIGYRNSKTGDTKSNDFGLEIDMTQVTIGLNVFF